MPCCGRPEPDSRERLAAGRRQAAGAPRGGGCCGTKPVKRRRSGTAASPALPAPERSPDKARPVALPECEIIPVADPEGVSTFADPAGGHTAPPPSRMELSGASHKHRGGSMWNIYPGAQSEGESTCTNGGDGMLLDNEEELHTITIVTRNASPAVSPSNLAASAATRGGVRFALPALDASISGLAARCDTVPVPAAASCTSPTSSPWGSMPVINQSPRPVGRQQFCPAGHFLVARLDQENVWCDECRYRGGHDVALVGCTTCDWDLCDRCMEHYKPDAWKCTGRNYLNRYTWRRALAQPRKLKHGDRVRLRQWVRAPRYQWKGVRLGDVGHLDEIAANGEDCTVTFHHLAAPWQGYLPEIEGVGSRGQAFAGQHAGRWREHHGARCCSRPGSEDGPLCRHGEQDLPRPHWSCCGALSSTDTCWEPFAGGGASADARVALVGDRVKVRLSVREPRHGWGGVWPGDVGVIKGLRGSIALVDFARASYPELGTPVAAGDLEAADGTRRPFGGFVPAPGDRVRLRPGVEPRLGWGNAQPGSVGEVVSCSAGEVRVDWPPWCGSVTELEVVDWHGVTVPGQHVGSWWDSGCSIGTKTAGPQCTHGDSVVQAPHWTCCGSRSKGSLCSAPRPAPSSEPAGEDCPELPTRTGLPAGRWDDGLDRSPPRGRGGGTAQPHDFTAGGDQSLGREPVWPPKWKPPKSWGGGGAPKRGAEGLRKALGALREALEVLHRCPNAPLGGGGNTSPRAVAVGQANLLPLTCPADEPLLRWVFRLPALWEAQDFAENFCLCAPPYGDEEDAGVLGGGHFHTGDIVCPAGRRHVPRTAATRVCCVAEDMLAVTHRLLFSLDPSFEPVFWHTYQNALARGGELPQPPKAPAERLAALAPDDAVEGFIAAFLYTYSLHCPNDVHKRRTVELKSPQEDMGWALNGTVVARVVPGGRASRADVRPGDVVLSVDGTPPNTEAKLQQRVAGASRLELVPARCAPRPLQISRALNHAMRERGAAALGGGCPERDFHLAQLDNAVAVMRPLLKRLDKFTRQMPAPAQQLFRGLTPGRAARQYRCGDQLLDCGFASLSSCRTVAWGRDALVRRQGGYAGGCRTVVMAGQALPAAWASRFPDEEEAVMPAGAALGVVSCTTDAVLEAIAPGCGVIVLRQLPPGKPAECQLELRIAAMNEQVHTFSAFDELYVEPEVTRGAGAGGARKALFGAFDEWLRGGEQWLVLTAESGAGQTSALLALLSRSLRAKGPRLPFYVALHELDGLGTDNWLRRELLAQLALEGPAGWGALEGREAVLLCDGADEAPLDFQRLRSRTLAASSGAGRRHKVVIAAGEAMLRRAKLSAEGLAGRGAAHFRLHHLSKRAQEAFVDRVAESASRRAVAALEGVRADSAELRQEALAELPGAQPSHALAAELHLVLRAHGPSSAQAEPLRLRCKESVLSTTAAKLASLAPGAAEGTLLFTAAAIAAAQLPDGGDSGAVMEAYMRRRAAAIHSRVPPSSWPPLLAGRSHADVALRVAEALAAALLCLHQWSTPARELAVAAAPLVELDKFTPAALLALLPGVPLQCAAADDPSARVRLPHRRIHEWLAGQWALRAARRGQHGSRASEVVSALRDWCGAEPQAAALSQALSAASAGTGQSHRAEVCRALLMGDHVAAEELLRDVAAACEAAPGADEGDTNYALWAWGDVLRKLGRHDEAEGPLRRALAGFEALRGPFSAEALSARYSLGCALSGGRGAPPAKRREGEALLRFTRTAYDRETSEAVACDAALAFSLESRGARGEAEQLRRQCLATNERLLGHDHPDTIAAAHRHALRLGPRNGIWSEAVALWKRCYDSLRRTRGDQHPMTVSAARCLARALTEAGRDGDADDLAKESFSSSAALMMSGDFPEELGQER